MRQVHAFMEHLFRGKSKSKSKICWFMVLAYCFIIYYLSSKSHIKVPRFAMNDKLMHAFEYGILSFLLFLSVNTSFQFKKMWQPMLIAILLSILWGVLDEFHQYFVPNRQTDVMDVVADGVGAFLAQSSLFLLWKFNSNKTNG